ncbi:MAG: metallophosphoesterase [Saprospiraceae bacterium]|nr:metallophosphoesterase [Saprospiraceae bacterium]
MRRFSFPVILLLCMFLIVVDAFAFHALQSITRTALVHHPLLITAINVLFWTFTFGLVASILILKIRFDKMHPRRRQLWVSSLYGLTVSSFAPKLLFAVILTILHAANFNLRPDLSFLLISIIGLLAGFLPFFVILFGIFRTVYRFKIYQVPLTIKNLPRAFDGLRIVHISDIHLGSFNYRYNILERAVHLINHLHADYVFFTGDLVNNYAWELKGWQEVLKKIKAHHGKYAVLGNHDYGDYSEWPNETQKEENFRQIIEFFPSIQFILLRNEAVVLSRAGAKMALIGVENWGKPPFKQYGNLQQAMQGVDNIDFKILLSHDPSHWSSEVTGTTDIALTLSGHTHGMQAGIKTRKKEWSLIQYKYKHWAGMYEENEQFLYVNRGLGWLGFPGRLGMAPEITLITLKSE